jgi:hypothetical protein
MMTRQQQHDIALLLRRAERTLGALADLALLVQLRADKNATVAARIQAALEDVRAVLEMVDVSKPRSDTSG